MLTKLLVSIVALSGASILYAQATPTATRMGDLKIGAGFANANSDYLRVRYNGVAAWADLDFTHHFGATAEFHYVRDPNGSGQSETTYEVGGRYHRTYGRFMPYAKVLYGRGVYNFTQPFQLTPGGPIQYFDEGSLAYNLIGAGAGVDYRVKPWLYVRGDWEYQRWFNFNNDSLTPNIFTVGASWHFR